MSDLDWDRVRVRLRELLRPRLSGSEAHDALDDLVQEGIVRLLRLRRRERVENLEALLVTLAHRTWIDYTRRRARWRRIFELRDRDTEDPRAGEEASMGDAERRIQLVILRIAEGEECRRLAADFFAERDWNAVARERGLSPAAVRKRWSRCLREIKEKIARDPWIRDLLGDA